MKIEKEYDVQELANEIKEEIKNCFERGARNVWINPLTAQGCCRCFRSSSKKR